MTKFHAKFAVLESNFSWVRYRVNCGSVFLVVWQRPAAVFVDLSRGVHVLTSRGCRACFSTSGSVFAVAGIALFVLSFFFRFSILLPEKNSRIHLQLTYLLFDQTNTPQAPTNTPTTPHCRHAGSSGVCGGVFAGASLGVLFTCAGP